MSEDMGCLVIIVGILALLGLGYLSDQRDLRNLHYAPATLYCPGAPPLVLDSVVGWHRTTDGGPVLKITVAPKRTTRIESTSCTIRWSSPSAS